MTEQFEINGDETFATYGWILRKGAYAELLKLPRRKDPSYAYKWHDENGTSYNDEEPPYFETSRFVLPSLLVGSSEADFLLKYQAFYDFITSETFFYLKAINLNKTYKVRYIEANGLQVHNLVKNSNGRVYCPFDLVVDYDFETAPEA